MSNSLTERLKGKGIIDISHEPSIGIHLTALETAVIDFVLDRTQNDLKAGKSINLATLPNTINTITLCLVRQLSEDLLTKGVIIFNEMVKKQERDQTADAGVR